MATLKKTVSKRAEATVRDYLTTDQEKTATRNNQSRSTQLQKHVRARKFIENGTQEPTKDRCCQGTRGADAANNKDAAGEISDQKVISWREVRSRKSKRAKMIEEGPL